MARVIPDASHSTDAATIEGSVWELVFQTDEMYYTLAVFPDKEIALTVADRGNSLLYPDESRRGVGFELREHKLVTAVHSEWSRQDFLDELDGWDIEDYFLPDPDPEEE